VSDGDRFAVTRIDELPEVPVPAAGIVWRPIRRTLGIQAFGVNAYTADAGQTVVEEHTEERLGHEELYVVVAGRATFELDAERVDAPAGTLVFLRDPSVRRHAVAEEPGTTVLAVGGKPGEPFSPSAWEWYFAAETQPTEQGIATIRAGIEQLGEIPPLLYGLACLEGRAGRIDEARAHLEQAVAGDPTFGEYAKTDPDLKEVVQ